MSKLRKQLREQASEQLDVYLAELDKVAQKITKGSNLAGGMLLKIAGASRNATTRREAVTILINQAEADIYAEWQERQADMLMLKETKK